MSTQARSTTLYQSATPAPAPAPKLLLKYSCYHCLEPVFAVDIPDQALPERCPVCARKILAPLSMRPLAQFSELDFCWRIVQQAQGRASCEDVLTRSYKRFNPSDYDEAKQDFWDFSNAALSLVQKLRQEPHFYDSPQILERQQAAEARMQNHVALIPKSDRLARYLQQSQGFRQNSLQLALSHPSPLQIVDFQLEHLEGEVWGWWFSSQGKEAVLQDLRSRKERYLQLQEARP